MNARSIICRLCLVAEGQMFNLNHDNLRNCYYNLTGVMSLGMYPYICYECIALLKRFGNFRSKCLTADQILKNVNIRDVGKIDRESIGLTSTLTFTTCISVTINSSVDLKTSVITVDVSDEDEDTKSDKKPDLKKDVTKYFEDFVKELEVDFDEEIDTKFDNNGDDSVLNFTEDNPNVSAAAILEDHSYSGKNKTKNELVQKKKRNKRNKLLNKTMRENHFDYLNGVATITLLSPEDVRKALDERKQTKKYINSKFKCHFCYRGYSLKSTFDNHMKIHTPERGNFECDYCSSRFKVIWLLRFHLEDIHTWKFECNTCSHVCFDAFTAKKHANTHSATVVKSYNCDLCSSVFKSYKSMVGHKRSKHALNTVPCVLCGDTFSTDSGLKIHAKVMHEGETEELNGPFCDLCDVRFATEVAWKRHFVLSDKHEGVRIGCEVCGEVFDTREKLREHAREYKHFNHRMLRTRWPIACIYCTQLIANKNEYESHMSENHQNMPSEYDRTFVRSRSMLICEICGMQFKIPYFLKRHYKERHSDRPQFVCKICGKPFKTIMSCQIHKSTHASVDERTCKICGNVLSSKAHVRIHISRVHLGVRPYKCTICDKTFINPCEVKYHIKYTHNKEPWPKPNRRTKRTKKTSKTLEA